MTPRPNSTEPNRRDDPASGPGAGLWSAKKRILSLDGGGVRGIVAIAFLEQIEKQQAALTGKGDAFRLADHFDLIGGTSTGAIIASALATGKSVSEIKQLYFDLATRVFRRRMLRLPLFHVQFESSVLKAILTDALGDITLDDPAIRTHLALILKRVDTGSPWILSNIPSQPYWEDGADKAFTGNRHYNLVNVIRASTAAPYFFGPEEIAISDTLTGRFVDGGVTPYNAPMIPLLMLATMRRYGLCWPVGPENLSMISIGTGRFQNRIEKRLQPAATFAVDTLQGLIQDCQSTSLMLMQWLSDPAQGWWLNGDIEDLGGDVLGGRPMLSFQRHDIQLEAAWLQDLSGEALSAKDIKRLRRMDDPSVMLDLYALASMAAKKQVLGIQGGHGHDWEHLELCARLLSAGPCPDRRMQPLHLQGAGRR